MTTSPSPAHTAATGAAALVPAARSHGATYAAHRDTSRVLHCLSALARPVETPEVLLAVGLEALAEAFEADVVAVVRSGAPGRAAGRRDVVAFRHGGAPDAPRELPELPVALGGGPGPLPRVASWSAGSAAGAVVVAGTTALAGARFAPSPQDPTCGSVLQLRSAPDPFTAGDLDLLASLVERLLSAARGAESRRRAEMLARAGERMAGHRSPLSPGLAEVLAELTGSTWSAVVELEEGRAALRGTSSAAGLRADPGWPSTDRALPSAADLGELLLEHDLADGHDHPVPPLSAPVRSLLRVPVLVGGVPQALLYALHADPGGFSPVVVSAVGNLASSLSSALESSRLYAALELSERTSRHRATHDALTGLANRALVREELERRIARTERPGRIGVLFCDLDGFKAVNDGHGHDAGDQLLQVVAGRMAAALRPGDLLARLGGDEFVAVVDGVPSEDLVAGVGARLLRAVQQPVEVVGSSGRTESVTVGGCFGGAVTSRGEDDAHERATALLRDADAAMYEAKRSGGRQVRTFDAAAALAHQRRHALDADLTAAVAGGAVEVHYQPVWDLVDDRCVGVEALARWEHPEQGRIAPDVFIPIAERTGAVTALGALVLDRACRDVLSWGAAGAHLRLSVNASPVELREPRYADGVLGVLAARGLPAVRLAVEVTEGLPLGGTEVEQLQALRAAGVRVLVDDFGVSHSDLARLKSLPVDGLKIDRSLVSGLSTSPDAHPLDRGLVEAILVVARAGGLSVVAEGVETDDERDVLVALGCRTAQGWLTGRPVPSDVLRAGLGRSAA